MAEKEYIEREALLSKTYDIKADGKTYRVVMYDDVILAPAADVVPVVRCKDCKHATFYKCKNDPCYEK